MPKQQAAHASAPLLVIAILVLRSSLTAAAPPPPPRFVTCQWPQLEAAVQRFSELLQFHTVGNASHPDHADFVVWELLDLWLHETYSEVLSHLQVEKLGAGQLSYLLTWPGSQPELAPVLFVAHTDVVPVAEDTLKDWTHPPFAGAIADGFVWGRGAMDVKVLVVLLMEAATALLAEGFQPQRTLMFFFGHDEELMGSKGAAVVAAELASRGVQLEVVVDEGSSIAMDGMPPIFAHPMALIGTAEKPYLQLEVTLSSKGGHSSMPPVDGSSAGDRLGRFLAAMSSRPAPVQILRPTSDLLAGLAEIAPAGISHLLAAASWLAPVRALLARLMARVQPETAAMVRTTVAVTRLQAGTAANVLPQTATVGLNFRLLPGHTADTAVDLVKGWLGRDLLPHATISIVSQGVPHIPVADAHGPHFAVMKAALQQHWRLDTPGQPPIPVLPLLLPALTDSRHFMQLCPNGALRFTPWTARRADGDFQRLHGVDERFAASDYACALNTYQAVLQGFGRLQAAVDGGGQQQQGGASRAAAHMAEL